MSTIQVAAALFQLQQLDLELDRLTLECQSIVNSLRGNPHLQRLRSDFAVVQQQLQAGQKAQQEAEWALADINRRLKVAEQRLYDGTITHSKELQSLQQEVQRLRAQQSRQEDHVREVTDAAESLQEMTRQREAALQEAEAEWAQESAALNARLAQAESSKQSFQAKHAQLAASMDPSLLARYQALRRSKQGRAVSKVEKNSCQWCRVILTASELQRVRVSSELQTCSNCGRILYYDR
jgi:predicted  nucleic acid-binding Zn-ribbon protein